MLPLFQRVSPLVLALIVAGGALLQAASPIRVALLDDQGVSGPGLPRVTQQLAENDAFDLVRLSGQDIAGGALADFDVVVFTGGSASAQAASLGDEGREQVRNFVRDGGGYVGICAGAYLACSGFSWGVGVLDAKTVSPKWQRGRGSVEVEILPEGEKAIGLQSQIYEVHYLNGPIIEPDGREDIPAYEPLALFRTELSENDSPEGIMVNSPAIARGTYGEGRVIVSSPHPEQTHGMEKFSDAAVKWAAGEDGKQRSR